MEKVGILAGVGMLPVECAKAAKLQGHEVYVVSLLPETAPALKDYADDYQEISIFKVGKILNYLKKKQVTEVTMIGKVTKELLYAHKTLPDFKAMQILMSLPNRKDDTVMQALVKAVESTGAKVVNQTALIRPLMPPAGTLTKREPTEAELKDMKFGFQMAKEIGRLDVGQTVVVKDLAVMALEAIEGTDACIKRGGELARGGAVVAKVAKPQQDNRFDVPAVGRKTLETMIAVGAKALVIEANETLLVERDEVIKLAEANDITIVAM